MKPEANILWTTITGLVMLPVWYFIVPIVGGGNSCCDSAQAKANDKAQSDDWVQIKDMSTVSGDTYVDENSEHGKSVLDELYEKAQNRIEDLKPQSEGSKINGVSGFQYVANTLACTCSFLCLCAPSCWWLQ